MTEEQHPAAMGEFTRVLGELTAELDPAGGWFGVFLRRDPEGMAACFQGRDLLPWDVAEALLQDHAALHGLPAAERVYGVVREAYRVAAASYDARPGGRQTLLDQLDAMIRERQYAAVRRRRLTGNAGGSPSAAEESARTSAELAWAEDDIRRASARCAELRRRLEALETAAAAATAGAAGAVPGTGPDGAHPGRTRPGEAAPAGASTGPHAPSGSRAGQAAPWSVPRAGQAASRAGQAGAAAGPLSPLSPSGAPEPSGPAASPEPPAGRPGPADGRAGEPASPRRAVPKRAARPRGARFAGLETEEENAAPAAPPVAPDPGPHPPAAPAAAPRGARFAGAYQAGDGDGERRERASAREREMLAAAYAEARDTAVRLRALRAAGRSGEAYALLSEAAARPAARLPLLAGELEREGLAAEVATLLWEAATLPPAALAAMAGALADAGRGDDCRALLAQCAGRPAAEVADTALALRADGRHEETAVLLGGMLRARTDEHAARVAEADPGALVPPLLEAAAGSPQRYRNLAHVLRGAGLPGIPDTA
ncbi:hypothetical protein LIX60_05845 [Streptomyces sp. S07_1.15]|uniref:hypothetical protein n=1 Tax=Streptomyces sp. S07_1.15 TaxID=2873925 RepID=UPI001D147FF1|nr:hypothetical protein [Streptomyces sp. S07_1.15]MCC3651007.1 hypothetical protein [Streptomyces sp. S07_1.15]